VHHQDTGSASRPDSCGLQVPGMWGDFRARHDHLGELPTAFFLQNVLQLHQERWVLLRVVSLVLGKIYNAILIPKI